MATVEGGVNRVASPRPGLPPWGHPPLELEHTGDPPPDLPGPGDPVFAVPLQAAAVAHEQPSLRNGDDLSERGYAIALGHASIVPGSAAARTDGVDAAS